MPLSRRDPAAGAASTARLAAGRSRIDYHLAPWREPSVLINCLTISMVACLVPRQPFSSDQIHLTLSTLAFTSLAFVNHLFPKRLDRLTHVVKAAYTQLLFASVGPATGLGARWWLLPAAVSGFDLVPLAGQRGGPCGRPVAEGIGATARWAAIAAGFWLARPPWWSIVVYGAFTGAYFHERRRRIGRGRRHEYGWLHCLETWRSGSSSSPWTGHASIGR